MESVGKIVEWNDDKGYGFIRPVDSAGGKLFFHVRDYQRQGRRPELGELVRFRAGSGKDGRPRADRVSRVVPPARAAAPKPAKPSREMPAAMVALAILAYVAVVAWGVQADRLPGLAAVALIFFNGATYIAYMLDKYAAQHDRRRVPESTLHLFELLGGWPGALIAQKKLRHKTRKQSYRVKFWLAVVVNSAALGAWLWGR